MNQNTTSTQLQMIDVNELSTILSVSKRTIWRMVSNGKLVEPIRIGGSIRWKLSDIETWISQGCPAFDPPK